MPLRWFSSFAYAQMRCSAKHSFEADCAAFGCWCTVVSGKPYRILDTHRVHNQLCMARHTAQAASWTWQGAQCRLPAQNMHGELQCFAMDCICACTASHGHHRHFPFYSSADILEAQCMNTSARCKCCCASQSQQKAELSLSRCTASSVEDVLRCTSEHSMSVLACDWRAARW